MQLVIMSSSDWCTAEVSGFLLEAGSRVLAPVYFEQSTRLLKVRNHLHTRSLKVSSEHVYTYIVYTFLGAKHASIICI